MNINAKQVWHVATYSPVLGAPMSNSFASARDAAWYALSCWDEGSKIDLISISGPGGCYVSNFIDLVGNDIFREYLSERGTPTTDQVQRLRERFEDFQVAQRGGIEREKVVAFVKI